MPQYSFECQTCRKTFNIDTSMLEYAAMQKNKSVACPECGATKVVRMFAGPVVPRLSGGAQSGACGPGCCCG